MQWEVGGAEKREGKARKDEAAGREDDRQERRKARQGEQGRVGHRESRKWLQWRHGRVSRRTLLIIAFHLSTRRGFSLDNGFHTRISSFNLLSCLPLYLVLVILLSLSFLASVPLSPPSLPVCPSLPCSGQGHHGSCGPHDVRSFFTCTSLRETYFMKTGDMKEEHADEVEEAKKDEDEEKKEEEDKEED